MRSAAYLGNPNAHNLDALLYGRVLLKALGTRNIFSATTVDQMPKHVSAGLMFGAPLSIPVPDVDRTDYLVMLGANPLASNGSLLTAPDMRGRLRAIRERGGHIVVFDPRRSRTAEEADEHHFIRPGTDAHLLFAIVHVLFDEDLADPGPLAEHCAGLDELQQLAAGFAPEIVADVCGIAAGEIRRMARELAAAERAAVYGRIGTCTQEFGTLASWLVDVVNVLTGNLDRPGGAMFTRAAAGAANTRGTPGKGKGFQTGRWHTRVRGLAEALGEFPVACLAEEIDTPGRRPDPGPVHLRREPRREHPELGPPGACARLAGADGEPRHLRERDDASRRRDPAGALGAAPLPLRHRALPAGRPQRGQLLARDPGPGPDVPPEWHTLLRLTGIAAGQGVDADVDAFDDFVIGGLMQRDLQDPASPLAGRDQQELLAELAPRRGPERMLDWMLRSGPYGDHFGADPEGLTLERLEAEPHGIDLGPLEPRIPEVLRTPSGKIELAPEPIVADVGRLTASLAAHRNGGMVLIGRRQLRSNNSWMHNVPNLVRGKDRCTAHVHPDDAARLGLEDGGRVTVASERGSIEVPVEVTDAIMPGVVSVPHGWGHDDPEAKMEVAAAHAGANSNILADESAVDVPSGNAVLNGIPVELAPVRAAEPAAV